MEPSLLSAQQPAIIVIFGITGDLSRRKLLPALYHLLKEDLLHEKTVILGLTRRSITADDVLAQTELCINEQDGICDPAVVKKVRERLKVVQLDVDKDEAYVELSKILDNIEEENKLCMNRLYYLSVPPQATKPIVELLGNHGLNKSCRHGTGSTRLLIEKPFGYDLASAQDLINILKKHFTEEQLFRIDHYLAKESVQNILIFRHSNIFEELWSDKFISHIVVSASEKIGIEGRVSFYEELGALRDIIQSHLFQLLSLVTLDLPASINSENIHRSKLQLLNAIKPIAEDSVADQTVRGQYKGYKEEVSNPLSSRETYAAIQIQIANQRWEETKVLLKTGKALDKKETEIKVVFRPVNAEAPPNVLIFRLQPKEGIELDLEVKKPGLEREVQIAAMDFSYKVTFDDNGHPDAYERVLVDAVKGDHTLFSTSDEVLASWKVVESVIRVWEKDSNGLEVYDQGSIGPSSAEKIIKRVSVK